MTGTDLLKALDQATAVLDVLERRSHDVHVEDDGDGYQVAICSCSWQGIPELGTPVKTCGVELAQAEGRQRAARRLARRVA